MAVLSKFTCDGCHRTFAWKPELSGKKLRCKCGAVLAVPRGDGVPVAAPTGRPAAPIGMAAVAPRISRPPAAPPPKVTAEDEPSLDDLYAFADEAEKARQAAADDLGGGLRCPGCTVEAAPGALLCTTCGMNFQTGKRLVTAVSTDTAGGAGAKHALGVPGRAAAAPARGGPKVLGYAARSPQAAAIAEGDSKAMTKLLMGPAICFAIGLALTFANYVGHSKYSVGLASVALSVNLLISVFFIFVGCLIGVKLLSISLGSPQEAALKIGAVALLPSAVAGLIGWQFGIAGEFAGWGVSLLMYYTMLVIFFELDGMDVSILTTIIWLLQAWVAYAVIALLVAAMFGGSSGLSGGAMGMIMGGLGGGGQGTLRDTSPAGRMNVRAERYKIAANAFEAKEWLAGAETRTIWGLDRAQSVAAIDGLYDAGSPEVYVAEVHQFGPKEVADKVVADLPDDQPTRDKIVAVQMESFKTRDLVPRDHGTGQEFVILDYDGNDD